MRNVLRGKMAEHGLTVKDLADVIGISYQALQNKLHGRSDFTLTEAKKVVRFFNAKGDSQTVEDIFFAGVSTIEDKQEISG